MRVFLLGVDGATYDLILPWARQGKLPNLATLLKNSYFGELASLPPITPAGWTSIITGVNCGKHGLADFLKLDLDSYQLHPTNSQDRKVRTIYNMLGEVGKKNIILNYPMTYPAEELNGSMVTGLQTPRIDDRCSYPPELIQYLEQELGEVLFMANYRERQSREDFLSDIKNLVKAREKMILHFIKKQEFDFFATVFMATDIVSHAFWKYMDENHPGRKGIPPEELDRFNNAVLDVYIQVDTSIGKIIEALQNKDTAIILVSDHGSGPLYKFVNLNKFLVEKGYMTLVQEKTDKGRLSGAISRFVRSFLSNNPARNNEKQKKDIYFHDVDWDHTKAYSWGNLCSVSLNLSGREKSGIVRTEEAEALKKEIAAELMKLADSDGKRIVDAVGFREDVFTGTHTREMPDMYMVMRDISYVGRGINPVYRDIPGRPLIEDADLSGTHRVDGIYAISDIVAKEKFVARAGGLKLTGRGYKVYDVAPTILHLFGIEIPDYFDGRVMDEAFLNNIG